MTINLDMLEHNTTTMGKIIMPSVNIKDVAHQLIDQLPEGCSWNDVIYEIVVRREIELGLEDSDAGRLTTIEDVRKEFGLDKE